MPNTRIDLVVGTYTRLGGRGLIPLTFDSAVDRWTLGEPAAITNASFGVHSTRHRLYYFVEEADVGRVSSHAGPPLGWHRTARVPTEGAAPCHLALNPAQDRLAVANYESGSVGLFRLAGDGTPITPPALCQLIGSGPNRERQEHSHAHWVGFDGTGQRLHCVDLGGDRIIGFSLTNDDLSEPFVAYRAPSGTGPRHLAYRPGTPFALLISELASTLTVLRLAEDGTFAPLHTVSTLPADDPDSLGGAIAINRAGTCVYVTNRGHDSIAVFSLDGAELRLLQHVPSAGASPRHILLLEAAARLLVANEEGGTVAAFAIEADGRLTPHPQMIEIPGAVFLAEV